MADAFEPLRGLLHRVRGAVSRQRHGENSGLRIVRAPDNAEIDIVAVHGLGGEGFRSWITWDPLARKPKSWLEELLGKDVPNARIMTYGYMSDSANYRYLVRNVLYGRALDLVQEFGAQRKRDGTNRRPVFFIAHSLGGWIVKRALVISAEAKDSLLKDIELSTCGVAFFGTLSPGRPSSPSPLAHVIRRTTSGLSHDSRRTNSLPAQPQPQPADMEWLENQMEAFKAITAGLPRLSFHETKQSSDGFVVAKRHSILGSDGSQIPLNSTHSDLIKFHGRDANYKTFLAKFREVLEKSRASGFLEAKQKEFDLAAVHTLDFLKFGFAIPYKIPGEPALVIPRLDLVEHLEAIFNPDVGDNALQLRIANLWGPEGSGKSSLAKYYAESHSNDISFVFWIWAESHETMEASYLQFASDIVEYYSQKTPRSKVENDLGLTGIQEMLEVKSIMQLDALRVKSVVQAVKDWLLRPENDNWLLIFDHVESPYEIFDFIPLKLSGRVILTSRDENSFSWGARLHVGVMTDEQAVKLMETITDSPIGEDPAQLQAATDLVRRLEHHPRNITMAAHTMRKQSMSALEYEQSLQARTPLQLIGSAIDQSPHAKTVLRISALLSASVIPVAIFTVTHLKQAPARFMKVFDEVRGFHETGHLDEVLQHLMDNGFIQSSDPNDTPTTSQDSSSSMDSFVLDPDARDHVRASLSAEEQAQHAWLACNVCVDGIRQEQLVSSSLAEIHEFGRIMSPHAKACYEDWSTVLGTSPGEDDIAWHVLGHVCMTQGAADQAIGCFELALKRPDLMEPIERIQVSLSLATLLQQKGELEKSKATLSNIDADALDQALGFRIAIARASIAAAQRDFEGAEDQFERLEREQEEILGPTNTFTLSTVQQLAYMREQLNKLEEAQALYRRIYISYQKMMGQSHPVTLKALEDLAHISMATNAIDEAEARYKQAEEIKIRTLGPKHPSTAYTIQKLAIIDDMRGRFSQAQAKYRQVLEIAEQTVGKADPLFSTTKEDIALSSRLEGESLYDEGDYPRRLDSSTTRVDANAVIATTVAVPGAGVKETARSPSTRAQSPKERRRRQAFENAERSYLEVLEIKKSAPQLFPRDEVVKTLSKLGEMYENVKFFEPVRESKMEELRLMLVESKRRGTV